MGGVGKTTMVKEVSKRVMEENLFDEFAMLDVSQKPDFTRIQHDIAEMLGLKLEEQNLMVRAGRLRHRLQESSMRTLIILDDVWEEFDLEELGITLQGGNYKGSCIVLFTSRNQGLWSRLETKRDIPLQVLSGDEAWDLFKEKADHSLETSPDLEPIAKEIVMECGRLPLALVTTGSALLNKGKYAWNHALRQLRMPCPSGEHAKVHQSLELSYNYLENDEAKSLFLLCCMFEEDYDIPIENLVRYVKGLNLLEGSNELEATRDQVFVLIDQLKSCHLLLDSERNEHVKMHDMVRDVAISIAARDKQVFVLSHDDSMTKWPKEDMHEHYTHISLISMEVRELSVGLRGPETELLRCTNCVLEATNNFFEGMGELKVADVQRMKIPQLPPSLRFLRNLRTLCLERCLLENISVIGKLPNLEILSFRASNIKELPEEIGRLANLRLLDLSNCYHLKRISPGVISGLVQLQELYMRDCGYSNWEGEGKEEGRNASLSEFESLSNLNTLEIRIKDVAVLPQIPLFTKLTKYKILIGAKCAWPVGIDVYGKFLKLKLYTCIPSECGINSLLKSTEYLHLEGEGSKDMVLELVREGVEGLQHKKYMIISDCDTPECLANTLDWAPPTPPPVVFPILAELNLYNLTDLREICHGKFSTVSFGKLSSLEISFCKKLGNLFQLSIARGLVQLKQLQISNCDIMEEVIWKEQGEDHVHDATTQIEFPKLEIMRLSRLPRLICFCRGIDKIKFPLLKELSLGNLPMLKRLFFNKSNMSFDSEENHSATFLSFFPQTVAFPSLEKLLLDTLTNLEELGYDQLSVGPLSKLRQVVIQSCGKLPNDVPSQLLARFPNLEELNLSHCSLRQVFDLERVDCKERNSEMLCPLKSLGLYDLPKLNNVPKRDPIGFMYIQRLSILCVGYCDSLRYLFSPSMTKSIPQLQRLTYLHVGSCDSLTYLFSPSMMKSIPQLRELEITNCKMMSRIVEEENGDGDQSSVDKIDYFPQLKTLVLSHLPVLERFCQFTHDWELPLVERIDVFNCPEMKTFSLGFLRTPKLHNVYGGGDEYLWMGDLNSTILHLYEKHQEEEKEEEELEETNDNSDDDNGGDVAKSMTTIMPTTILPRRMTIDDNDDDNINAE